MLLFTESGFAQSVSSFTVGESGFFDIRKDPGISYCWGVSDKIGRNNGAESDKVAFLTTKYDASVRLKWEKAGTFFVTVTGFNQIGCSNSKIFIVKVIDKHIPVANDDYHSTDWLNSIRINLLSNDFDSGKDLDTSTLKILTKPEFGEVTPGQSGAIVYSPLLHVSGKERIYYRICDSLNQCDTSMVVITIKDPYLFLPQGISPNGDGVNDYFVIGGLNAYPKSRLTIFSRDGNIIYNSEDYQNDWKGVNCTQKHNLKTVPVGTYYYLLQPGGSSRVIKGFFYLTY